MGGTVVPRDFYRRDTAQVAQELLGKVLVRETGDGVCTGRIVETEAYYGNHTVEDEACHARTRTDRTEVFYGDGGYAYVYVCYGIHHMLNTITGEAEEAGGVLIRAVEPMNGIDLMRQRRDVQNDRTLTDGPGKLCEAFAIDKDLYGHDLTAQPLYIQDAESVSQDNVVTGTRIGISKAEDLELRFYEKNNRFVSRG